MKKILMQIYFIIFCMNIQAQDTKSVKSARIEDAKSVIMLMAKPNNNFELRYLDLKGEQSQQPNVLTIFRTPIIIIRLLEGLSILGNLDIKENKTIIARQKYLPGSKKLHKKNYTINHLNTYLMISLVNEHLEISLNNIKGHYKKECTKIHCDHKSKIIGLIKIYNDLTTDKISRIKLYTDEKTTADHMLLQQISTALVFNKHLISPQNQKYYEDFLQECEKQIIQNGYFISKPLETILINLLGQIKVNNLSELEINKNKTIHNKQKSESQNLLIPLNKGLSWNN